LAFQSQTPEYQWIAACYPAVSVHPLLHDGSAAILMK
jgi:hypothetical protein